MGELYFGSDGGHATVLGEHVNLLQNEWDPKARSAECDSRIVFGADLSQGESVPLIQSHWSGRPLADGLAYMGAHSEFDGLREAFEKELNRLEAVIIGPTLAATVPRVRVDEIEDVTHYIDSFPLTDEEIITSLIKEINREVSVSFNMSTAVDPVKFAQIFGLPVQVLTKEQCCQPLTAVPARPHKKKRIRKKWLKKYGWKLVYGPEKAWIFKDPVRGDILCVGPDTYKTLRETGANVETVTMDD